MSVDERSENDLHWMAGFFDGEGSISIARMKRGHGHRYRLYVDVCQTNPRLLHLFLRFGGTVHARRETARCKRIFAWRIGGSKACEFLKMIMPHLKHARKQEVARLAIEFQEKAVGMVTRRRSMSRLVLQRSYWKRAKELNKRGKE